MIENARREATGKSFKEKFHHLVKTIDIAASTASTKALSASEAKGILKVLQDYAYALETLDRYDHQSLTIEARTDKKVVSSFPIKFKTGDKLPHLLL